jgi:hypothetical protein
VIPLFVGFDPREAAAYHVFCQSVIDYASVPVQFIPLHNPMLRGFDGQKDGTNAFIYSRYLIPSLMNYRGWAMFADGDMVVRDDIENLWCLRDERYAVMCVKHDYKTGHPRKYIGTPLENDNVDYERKNWSSVMMFNCSHPSNRVLNEWLVAEAGGSFLHRFKWLKDEEIGALPPEWNVLVGEQSGVCKLAHYTLGVPGFRHYANCDHSDEWFDARDRVNHLVGEKWELRNA